MQDSSDFYLSKNEPNKSCLLALRSIILKQDSEITETVKYGMPCFCYKKRHFCYLWTDKKTHEPYILFVEGNLLEHPELIAGNRARMKTYTVNPNEDLQIDTIELLLHMALDLFKKGVVKI
jgi:hypothetical protein